VDLLLLIERWAIFRVSATATSLSLDKDQLDEHLLYFIFILQYVQYNPLHVSSINVHHQEINYIDVASGIVLSTCAPEGQ